MTVDSLTVTLHRNAAQGELVVPQARVHVSTPSGKQAHVELGLGRVRIGQSPDCELVLDDPAVSRVHAELRRDHESLVLTDLGSKNGTFINGVRIDRAPFSVGHRAQVGSTALWVETTDATKVLPLFGQARFGDAVGQSVLMRVLFWQLDRVARGDESLLLLGEMGTGKEVLARAVHAASARREAPFVVLDCRSLSPELVDSELFGHEKGAFTGAVDARRGLLEEADGGTLYLDGLGDLALELQPKLLRALEQRQYRRVGSNTYKPFDVRLITAAEPDLPARIRAEKIRSDLYFRVAVTELTVPPLRDRRDDIPLILDTFLKDLEPPRSWAALPPNVRSILEGYHWPGNVRELRNVATRLALFEDQPVFPLAGEGHSTMPSGFRGLPLVVARDAAVESFEREYVANALAAHGHVVQRAAKALGISRQYLHRLISRYKLSDPD